MERRHAITALGGLVATSALLALPRTGMAQTATTGGAATTMPAAQPIAASTYKMNTLMGGTAAKLASTVAVTKASHAKVRQFAQFEVEEQTAIAQVLTDVNNPPPVPLDAMHQQMLTKLQATSGKAFDVAYIENQIAGHRELLAIQQGFLTGAVTDRDLEHIAVLARVSIMMHLTLLQDLQHTVGV